MLDGIAMEETKTKENAVRKVFFFFFFLMRLLNRAKRYPVKKRPKKVKALDASSHSESRHL